MFFYRITCLNELQESSMSEEGVAKMVKNDIDSYNKFCEEKQDEAVFLFMVHDKEDKFVFDIVFNKSLDMLNMVDDIIKNFIEALGKKFQSVEKSEINIEELGKDIRRARNSINDIDDEIIETKFNIKFYDRSFFEAFNEFMINKIFCQDELIDYCDKNILNEQLVEEIKRIYLPKTCNSFCVPVHYILNMRDKMCRDSTKVLIDALHSNGRMLRDKYTVMELSNLSGFENKIFSEIMSIFKINDGGVVVIPLDFEIKESHSYHKKLYKNLFEVCKQVNKNTTIIFQISSSDDECLKLIKTNLPNLSFVEIKEATFHDDKAKLFLTKTAKEFRYSCEDIKDLLDLIEPNKYYDTYELENMFLSWHQNYMVTVQYPQYSFVNEKDEKNLSMNDGYKKLDKLIGLESIKKIVTDFINYSKVQKACDNGEGGNINFNRHLCFYGNPGTAKTTVARIFAQIMKEENLLSNGELIEVGRADIVSQYLGGTAPQVKRIFQRAIGNVLFIDEAYSLCDGHEGLYGDEAINTIVQEMENNRDKLIVIFAGYKKEMQKFLDRNAGLRSRIAFEVEFPDYSDDELLRIAEYHSDKMDFDISQCKEKIIEAIARNRNEKNFGNGRFIRNLLEKARMKQATRIVNQNLLNTPKMRELLPEDIDVPTPKVEKLSFGFHS